MMKRERSCTEHVESTVASCDARLRRVSQGTTCRDELKPEGRLAQPVDDFWTIGSRSSGVCATLPWLIQVITRPSAVTFAACPDQSGTLAA